MRKWRPAYKCLYVIPEIKGNLSSLEIILNRILPLRFSIGQEDKLIFLGDYIDQGDNSNKVLDLLINLKKELSDQIFFIKGNHEELFLRSLKSASTYQHWLSIGGDQTITSYLQSFNLDKEPFSIPNYRIVDFISEDHIEFIKNLSSYLVLDDYIFTHNGLNLEKKVADNSDDELFFTNSFSKDIKKSIKNKTKLNFNNTYVISHNYKDTKPFITSNCLMLGGNAPEELVIFELNSMSCSIIQNNKSRFYKHTFSIIE